jgi:hypothetical protein
MEKALFSFADGNYGRIAQHNFVADLSMAYRQDAKPEGF